MSPKLKNILEKAADLASSKSVRNASDEDFIARVDAVCLMRRIYDGVCTDSPELLRKIRRLYPEFARRIDSKAGREGAMPLVKAMHRFVFGATCISRPIGVKEWERALAAYESKFGICAGNVSLSIPRESKGMTLAELKRRAPESRGMQVAYLSELTAKEFDRLSEAADERLLRNQFKEIDEEIIPDILPVRITSKMSVPCLHALETIFSLRSQLAFEEHDWNEPAYANLQVQRLTQISRALLRKYRKAHSLNEKIEILERLETLEQCLSCEDSAFALEEAGRLLKATSVEGREGEGLNEFQRLRLRWLPGVDAPGCDRDFDRCFDSDRDRDLYCDRDKLVALLLPKASSAFDIATLSLAKDFCSEELRNAIVDKFTAIFNEALSKNDTTELGTLLSSAATWNADPSLRCLLAALTEKAQFLIPNSSLLISENSSFLISEDSSLLISENSSLPIEKNSSLPIEFRLNAIAAEIYSRLDSLAGKYKATKNIPA